MGADQSEGDWVFKRGGLKETGAKTECFSMLGASRTTQFFSTKWPLPRLLITDDTQIPGDTNDIILLVYKPC